MRRDIEQRTDLQPTVDQSTRDKIVAAALQEFAARGKEGARVDRIAETAGVNKAMIYYHFHSKHNLYVEVVTSFFRDLVRQVRGQVSDATSLAEALAIMAERHAEAFLEAGPIRPIVLRELANPNPEIAAAIADVFTSSGLPHKIMTLMEQGIHDGQYRPIDLRQALAAFVSMSLGYFVIAPITDVALGIEDRAAFAQERQTVIVDLFLNGMKVR